MRIYKNGFLDLEFIQIYGERNSGTNILKNSLECYIEGENRVLGSYKTKYDDFNGAKIFGYKHYYPRYDKLFGKNNDICRKTLFLVIYKNPYTWIRSMINKPYHFKNCLEGMNIEDLENFKIEGFNIYGKSMPDVHPDTGDLLTLFDLRRYKIEQFEDLKYKVENVGYVNYEELLINPFKILTQITKTWPSLFVTTEMLYFESSKKYLEKYIPPKSFTELEMEIMNRCIDWEKENLIGYKKNNLIIDFDRGPKWEYL